MKDVSKIDNDAFEQQHASDDLWEDVLAKDKMKVVCINNILYRIEPHNYEKLRGLARVADRTGIDKSYFDMLDEIRSGYIPFGRVDDVFRS